MSVTEITPEIAVKKQLLVADIAEYKEETGLNAGKLLFSIKNMDGSQLRSALAVSGAKGRSWGRDIRKDPRSERGALFTVDTALEKPSFDIVKEGIYGPRGILSEEMAVWVATSEGIIKTDKNFKTVNEIRDPFCHWMHALTFGTRDGKDVIIASSSRLGTILTIDKSTEKTIGIWHGWEHGFDTSLDGTVVTGDLQKAKEIVSRGGAVIHIDKDNPSKSLELLSTPKQAFRCTGLIMVENDLIATLFTGEVLKIKNFLTSPEAPVLLYSGTTNLHTPEVTTMGGEKTIWVADTMNGKAVAIDDSGGAAVYDFAQQIYRNIKSINKSEKIWLQGVKFINGLIVALDGTGNTLMIIDPANKTKRLIEFPDKNWAIHDFVSRET